jgi:uncharacterized membrane protein
VIIELPRDSVLKLFIDVEDMPKWQKGLQSTEIIEGVPGTHGAKTRLVFENGSSKTEMVETLIEMRLPDLISATYETKDVWNSCENIFTDLGEKTLWTMETQFVFNGFMKYLSLIMKKSFEKRTQADMEAFKAFAESQNDAVS